MIRIEIDHTQLDHSRLSLNDIEVKTSNVHQWIVNKHELPGTVEIFFRPFGLRPKLRINGCLLNPWFLGAEIYDHMIKFVLHPDWSEKIHKLDLLERERSLGRDLDDITKDLKIGRELHEDLVLELKNLLDEKSYPV